MRNTGNAVMGVMNWLSPKVSRPEMVLEVELKGKASAKPSVELRDAVRCKPLAAITNKPNHDEPKAY